MMSRRAFQLWSGLLICVFCGALIALAFVSRRPLCIDSKLVEKIDRISDSGTHTAYRCSLGKRVPYDGKLNQITHEFAQRLMPLERFTDYLGGVSNRITVTLLKSQETYFKIRSHEIYATEDLLDSPGQLEKAVLKIWLRDQVKDSMFENSLAEEVLSDFMWTAAKGKLDIYDPVSRTNLSKASAAYWPEILKSSTELCQTPWWPTKSAAICQALRGQSDSDTQIDFDSLRSLLTQAMNNAYEEVPAQERIAWLQDFAKKLSRFQIPEGVEAKQKNYLQAQQLMKKWIASLHLMNESFGNLFAAELEKRGYHDILVTVRFSALVIFDGVSKENQKLVEKSLLPLEETHFIGYKQDDQMRFASHGVTIPSSEIGSWMADKVILVGCGSPPLQKLEDISAQSERLLFVDLCKPTTHLDVASYLLQDAQAFAGKNKDVNFIEFHLPSLKLAMQKVEASAPQNPNLLVELLKETAVPEGKDKKASILTEALGWQKPTYSATAKAYRSQSAIEAINWYRVN